MNREDEILDRFRDFLAPSRAPEASPDERFGQIAVARRLVNLEQLEESLREQERLKKEGQDVRLGQLLIRRKWITPEQFEELLALQERSVRHCRKCDRTYDIAGHPEEVRVRCLKCGEELASVPPENRLTEADARPTPYAIAKDTADEARLRLGKYVLRREIARGGMAVVFEAEDTELRRRVALKIIREGEAGAQTIMRLHREAAIAGQLQHPNIVGIHEVGMLKDPAGRPTHFIVMDYVEGGTLADELADPTVKRPERLRMLEDAARAVAFAHEKGVVHRDLKPSNVLVDATGRVMLTDFGLARANLFATQLTQEQAVMGTPQYMAPEQVEGRLDKIDARTDVYALGSILYEILVGHPPFFSQTMAELFHRVVHEEPIRPMRLAKSVERDLEIICMKSLEKRREDRYAGAKEFAEDLDRFRRGDPISAHAPSILYRLRKRLVRHKAILGVLGCSLLLSVVLGAVLIVKIVRTGRGGPDVLGPLRTLAKDRLSHALEMRRAGDTRSMEEWGAKVGPACDEVLAERSDLAEPHYWKGRIYRALMKFEDALREQEEAIRRDPHYAPALYEHLLLSSRVLEETIDLLRQEALRDGQDRSREEIARGNAKTNALRRRMEEHLRELERQNSTDLPCARGLIAYAMGDLDAAERPLSEAVNAPELFEEAYETLGMLERQRTRWEKSVEWLTKGLERDKGYSPFYIQRGFAEVQWADQLSQRGEDPEKLLQSAVADYTRAMEIRPEDVAPWTRRGHALVIWANHVRSRGGDGTKLYEQALIDFEEACKKKPEDDEPYRKCGVIRVNMARDLMTGGGDPTKMIDRALEDFDQALRRDPHNHDTWLRRARAFEVLAESCRKENKDPTAWYDKATESYEEAVKLNPKRPEMWMAFGGMLWSRAVWRSERGEIDGAGFERALQCNQEAIRCDDGKLLDNPWRNRGGIYFAWAAQEERKGLDPIRHLEKAAEEYREGLRRNPGSYDSKVGLGQTLLALGARAAEPGSLLGEAIKTLDAAARSRYNSSGAWILLGHAYYERGRRRADGREDFQAALASYAEVKIRDPQLGDTLRSRVERIERLLQ